MAECQEELEKEMDIIGATAIEDKLQDKVGETISSLKEAGIKVWVLTGDKVETAINIGFSCKLLDSKQKLFEVDCPDTESLMARLQEVEKEINSQNYGSEQRPYAMVITGQSLVNCESETAQNKLYSVFRKARVVVACRVSPKQKKDIVELVKSRVHNTVTLAIGDGANDVNMITAAHVGVGIRGLEGYQVLIFLDQLK